MGGKMNARREPIIEFGRKRRRRAPGTENVGGKDVHDEGDIERPSTYAVQTVQKFKARATLKKRATFARKPAWDCLAGGDRISSPAAIGCRLCRRQRCRRLFPRRWRLSSSPPLSTSRSLTSTLFVLLLPLSSTSSPHVLNYGRTKHASAI